MADVRVVARRDTALIPLMTALLRSADGPGTLVFSLRVTPVATGVTVTIQITPWMMDVVGPSSFSSGWLNFRFLRLASFPTCQGPSHTRMIQQVFLLPQVVLSSALQASAILSEPLLQDVL
jgi:hypothetical protein